MIKRPKISKEEIIADLLFLLVGAIAAFIAIFIFDIHWSFYPGQTAFPPSKYIFQTATPFLVGIPIGAIIGFIVLKLVFYAFMEEEISLGMITGKKQAKKK